MLVSLRQTFNDYCILIEITVEHPVAHVYTQNDLPESLIKHIQVIAKLLIMRTNLPISTGSCNFIYCDINSHQTRCIS